MNEIGNIEKWIVHALSQNSAVTNIVGAKIFAYEIPSGKNTPAIIFSFQSGRDTIGNASKRLLTRPLYQIKAVGVFDSNLRTVANQIDEIFQKATAVSYDGFIFSSRREQAVSYKEKGSDTNNGARHLGGLYRISCYPNPNS